MISCTLSKSPVKNYIEFIEHKLICVNIKHILVLVYLLNLADFHRNKLVVERDVLGCLKQTTESPKQTNNSCRINKSFPALNILLIQHYFEIKLYVFFFVLNFYNSRPIVSFSFFLTWKKKLRHCDTRARIH